MSERCAVVLPGEASACVGAGLVARRLQRAAILALVLSKAALLVDGVMADGAVQSSAVLAPHSVTRNAAMVTKLSDHSWSIAMGAAVADFLGANGPAEIVRYNWNKLEGAWHDPVLVSVVPVVPQDKTRQYGRRDHADLLELTMLGARRSGSKQVYRLRLGCTGTESNCRRACGGLGVCIPGCADARKTGHFCSARVLVTATIDDVKARRLLVTLSGSHTPAGTEATPPPLLSLRPDPALKRALLADCEGRETPATALQKLTPQLKSAQERAGSGSPSLFNGRYNPLKKTIKRAVKSEAKESRGGDVAAPLGDWARTNLLIREHLIPRGLVLEYEELSDEGGIVVIATPSSLQMAATHGKELGATDCKHDTTLDCRSMWSTYRVPVRWNTFGGVTWYGTVAWVAPNESQLTIGCALTAQRANLPCDDPTCSHPFEVSWEGGRFRRHCPCSPAFSPLVTIDKHMPSFLAVIEAGYRGGLLDGWHGYHAFNQFLSSTVLIRDAAATAAMWAFRLWTRSQSDQQAEEMRNDLVAFVINQASAPAPLWTLEQAADLGHYFLKCWHQPAAIRQGWIDGGLKRLVDRETGVASTGSNEGSHKHLDDHMFKLQRNRDVCTVVTKTGGIDASGAFTASFFDGEEKRYAEDEYIDSRGGLPKGLSVDIRVCEAKAAHVLLSRGADCIILDSSTAFVPSLKGGAVSDCIALHLHEPHMC